MPVVQANVHTVATRSGAGTQTVSGVTDQDGTGFIGVATLFQSAYAAINTLTSGNVAYPWYADSRGVDTGAVRSAGATADAYSPFNFKGVAGAISLGNHSLLDQWTDNFGGPQIYRTAKISAQAAGTYDILYDSNLRTGDHLLALALGGSGLSIAFTNNINGTYTTPAKPQGILSLPVPSPAGSGGTSGGTGGGFVQWGFATRDGKYGVSHMAVNNQSSNFVAQRSDAWGLSMDSLGVLSTDLPTISAWTDTSFTIANNNGGTAGGTVLAICGDDVRCAAGVITQDTTSFETLINPRVILFFSVARPSSLTAGSPSAQLVMGWATPVAQLGWWSGERCPGNVSPSFGARYESDSQVLRFGSPEGPSTTFHTTAGVTLIRTDGHVEMAWPTSDAGGAEVLWVAIGEEAIPIPPVIPNAGFCVIPTPPITPRAGCIEQIPPPSLG